MLNFIWRWLGGRFSSGRHRHARGGPIDPHAEREWVNAQLGRLLAHFAAKGETVEADPWVEWALVPRVVVWSIANGWAIGGGPPFDHVVGNDALGSARDAARFFARRYRERARRLAADRGPSAETQALTGWAEALMTSVLSDAGWPEELPGGDAVAARAQNHLFGPLFDPRADPLLGPVLRVVRRRAAAPGGAHHGIYFYLDLSGAATPRVFDALARRIIDIDAQFAPLVAYRVQYALAFFGIDFGNAAKETAAARLADEMRARYPDLSRRLDDYGATDGTALPVYFVDGSDRPFSAHACLVRAPGRPYTSEAKYFNCRDQDVYKQMEASPGVAQRLIAASIDPGVVADARRAFA